MNDRIIRVFPRRTKATPIDRLVRVAEGPLFGDEADEIQISVTFTWDIPAAEYLEKQWRHVAPVKMAGPALGTPGASFTPGQYLKKGYVITSRGCPNKCWFCDVWKREGAVRELDIHAGTNVLDDNLLACSDSHIKAVFEMLSKQGERIQFTGGLEAARLKPWHVEELLKLRVKQMFFANDGPEDTEPLRVAGKMLQDAGYKITRKILRAYNLIGYPGDTVAKAETRLKESIAFGFIPMAMLYKNKTGDVSDEWRRFQRQWARPSLAYNNIQTGHQHPGGSR